MQAVGRSPRTAQSYLEAGEQFAAHIGLKPVREIERGDVEAYLVSLRESGRSASTIANRYRSLQQFFRWLCEEGELDESPMRHMRPPNVPEQPVDVLTPDEQRALFSVTKGNSFEDRRDTAILRVLLATGMRVSELTGLRLGDVNLDARELRVLGKGARERVLGLSPKVVQSLDRYLRVRSSHQHASSRSLWIGKRGAVHPSGVSQILRKRAKAAGVANVHPHRFRHTHAHEWLSSGRTEGDLMRNAGWKRREMLNRYGASAADARARAALTAWSPGDDL